MTSTTDPRSRQRGPKPLLSRDAIVRAGLEALRNGGPAALTMRGVAARLETGPASLYAWVRNQRELQVLVLDVIAAEVDLDGLASTGSPFDRLVELLTAYGRRLYAYRGAALLALESPPTGPAFLDFLERGLATLEEAGVSPERADQALDSLVLLVTASLAEQDARGDSEGGQPVPDLYEAAVPAGTERWPRVAASIAHLGSVDGEERLADAIRTFIRGLTA